MPKYNVIWQPQAGKQEALVDCPLPIVGYGGARGGGKTDGTLGKLGIKAQTYKINAIYFRQEVTQADDLIERARELYVPLGADYKVQQKMFVFPNGGRIRFRGLRTLSDAEKFQGQNLTDAVVEEAGNYPDPAPIWLIFGALRSAEGIPTQLILTFNPGGVGNAWLKRIFVDPCKQGMKVLNLVLNEKTQAKAKGIFIPAKVQDNPILLERDPAYIDRLKLTGSEALVRAWLEGDFDIFEGAFFTLSDKNFTPRFTVPDHWKRYIGQDWGFRDPFAATWIAYSSGLDDQGEAHSVPKGKLVVYRSIKKTEIENTEQARIVSELSVGEKIQSAALDPACWANNGFKSIAKQLNDYLNQTNSEWFYQQAVNNRVAGWSYLTELFNAGNLLIMDDMEVFISDILSLPVDKNNIEDVDTRADDHCFTGDTKIITDKGLKTLKELQGKSGYVKVSQSTYSSFFGCRKTREDAEIVQVVFNDGSKYKCTPDHKFLTEDGWIQAKDLQNRNCLTSELELSAIQSKNLMAKDTIYADTTSSEMGSGYTGQFGNTIMEIFLKPIISIIEMVIRQIIRLRILSLYMAQGISQFIQTYLRILKELSLWQKNIGILQKNGTGQERAENGIKSIIKDLSTDYTQSMSKFASNVIVPLQLPNQSFAQTSANLSGGEITDLMMSKEIALSVQLSSKPTSTQRPSAARINVQENLNLKRCESVTPVGREDVYCLEVPGYNYFSLDNGVIVHNCADSLRYGTMQFLVDSVYSKPEQTKFSSNGFNLADLIKRHKNQHRESRI